MPDLVAFPKHPLYIPSKGRSWSMMTSRALTEMGVPHFVIAEPQEVDAYREAVERANLSATVLELDLSYKRTYELLDDLGLARSTGPGPARNFAWEHSIAAGARWHWVLDDNIGRFHRLHQNAKVKCVNPALFRAMEDFCDRYANVAMAGPHYSCFAPARGKRPPFITGTRIYSCNLIRNDVPFRWRGRYNEDSILSLDVLKAGWCTILFHAFLQHKTTTQAMKGGNTDEFYRHEGTTAKSQMLVNVHPDVARIAWRWRRVHHYVDYRQFRGRKLILRKEVVLPEEPNNYGMTLQAAR
jgi:hypothetical protein